MVFLLPRSLRPSPDFEQSRTYHTLVSNYEHVGAEGLFMTLGDLCKWDVNSSNNRLGKGGRALIDRVLTPGRLGTGEAVDYGFGINVGTYRGERFFGHDGAIHGYTSSTLHFPERDTSIVCLANHNIEGAWVQRNRVIDLIFPDTIVPTRKAMQTHAGTPYQETQLIKGSYQDPKSGSIWEVVGEAYSVAVRVNREWDLEIVPVDRLVFRAADPGTDLVLRFVPDETGRALKIQGSRDGIPFTLEAFIGRPLSLVELEEYAGEYHSKELNTVVVADIVDDKIRLRNRNRHRCSMDLVYSPTIKDCFIAFDPHPVSSQIAFLREEGRIGAFVYQDYDGDGREDLEFTKR